MNRRNALLITLIVLPGCGDIDEELPADSQHQPEAAVVAHADVPPSSPASQVSNEVSSGEMPPEHSSVTRPGRPAAETDIAVKSDTSEDVTEPPDRGKDIIDAIVALGGGYEWARAALDLSVTQVTDDEMVHLEQLTNLKVLDLFARPITDRGTAHLATLTNLEYLVLGRTKLTDAGLEALRELTNLKVLNLAFTQVSDSGLKNIAGLENLEELNLSNTQITDSGLVHLKGLPSLRQLWLDETQITDAGLEHLVTLTGLQTLDVPGTLLTEEGIQQLRAALPECVVRDGS